MKISKGKQARSRRVLLYGDNGIGKSSLAAQFPSPIFLNLEDGIRDLDCVHTDLIVSVREFLDVVNVELPKYKEFQTIVVDTVDWLEKYLMWEVASKAGKQTIEEIGYGRGYQSLERAWQEILFSLGYLWNQGKHIVFTCHQQRCAMKNPEGEDYNFFAPKLHRVGSACVSEWCDEVLCLKHSNASKKTEDGKTVPLAVSRVIACNDSLVVEAKNRLNMPNEIPLDFSVLAQYMFQPVQAPAKETK